MASRERPVGLQPHDAAAVGPGAALELGQQAAADPQSPRRLGDPHPLDVGRCVAVELETSAPDWLPAQQCDEEQACGRPHRVDTRGAAQRRIETRVEPPSISAK